MAKTKNIIFDLGGVLLNIDYTLTIQAFKKHGIKDFDRIFSQFTQDVTAREYEMGLINDDAFRHYIRNNSGLDLDDTDIDAAWNAMLLDFPLERLKMLMELKKDYRLFLLSNTNQVHYVEFQKRINGLIKPAQFDSLFEKAYYSHQMGMRKPDTNIFERVITENGLVKEETIFIDDSPVNIETAKKVGLKVYTIMPGDEITALIKNSLLQ